LVTQYWNNRAGRQTPIPARSNREHRKARTGCSKVRPQAVAQLPDICRLMPCTPRSHASQRSRRRAPVAQRNLYFSEVLLESNQPFEPDYFLSYRRGQTPTVFTRTRRRTLFVHSGTVEDWVGLKNRAQEDHIFHIHPASHYFRCLKVKQASTRSNDPAIRDTVDIPYWNGSGAYPSAKVRMDFRDPNVVGTFCSTTVTSSSMKTAG